MAATAGAADGDALAGTAAGVVPAMLVRRCAAAS